jgi:Streptomyces sporulation and cell division protein, SsgA
MMNSSDTTVSTELDFMLIGPDDMCVPLIASIYYTRNDPYAVRVAFHNGTGHPVEWVFARDLLAGGLMAAEGIGDIRLWPSTLTSPDGPEGEDTATECDVLNIEMSSPDGHAHVQAPAGAMSRFLERTYRVVPLGEETSTVDLDAELLALLQ